MNYLHTYDPQVGDMLTPPKSQAFRDRDRITIIGPVNDASYLQSVFEAGWIVTRADGSRLVYKAQEGKNG